MVSTLDAAKRVLVVLLRTLAATYNCAVGVTRDSSDAVIRKAYRTMSLKTHPDKGGAEEDQQNLNNAYQAWCEAARDKGGVKPAQLLTHKFTQHALPRLPRSHGGWPGRVPVVNLIEVSTGQSLPESKLTISIEPPLPLES